LDESADYVVCHTETLRSLAHGQPRAVFLSRLIRTNTVRTAGCIHPPRIPGFALSGSQTQTVERCGDLIVWPATGHASHHLDRFFRGSVSMLPGFELADPYF
jgi:hypothetical protein